jgi:membrane protein YqaA with SNARE-associated domain
MMFNSLYNKCMEMAAHPRAERYLAAVSIFESIFFPVPTALMVAPMAVARPERAVRIATIATVTSVLGGLFGYMLGFFAIASIEPILHDVGYWEKYTLAQEWFREWGFWSVAVAGFSPIPFKLFTITAGAFAMSVPMFLLASLIGRSAHFFLVALLMAWAGPRLEPVVRRYIEWLGWLTVAMISLVIYLNS